MFDNNIVGAVVVAIIIGLLSSTVLRKKHIDLRFTVVISLVVGNS
tara:strand:- start:458 stop:592 length:135 start_codon:yes stop_codon:yes gene_type:complete